MFGGQIQAHTEQLVEATLQFDLKKWAILTVLPFYPFKKREKNHLFRNKYTTRLLSTRTVPIQFPVSIFENYYSKFIQINLELKPD